jgi:nitrous oxide reductase accessory protein NosL
MRNRFSLLGLVLALAVVAGACAAAEAAGPPDIKYGRDICIQCGMIVSEEKFAAAYTTPDGEKLAFDDTGDLLVYQRSTGHSIDPIEAWVHDFETEEWITVADAFFVPTQSVTTPMGHGLISFSDEARAMAFAADVDGEVILWDVVLELPAMDGLVGHHHMDGEEMDHETMDHSEMGEGEMDHMDDMDHDEMEHDGMSHEEMHPDSDE